MGLQAANGAIEPIETEKLEALRLQTIMEKVDTELMTRYFNCDGCFGCSILNVRLLKSYR